MKKNYIQIVVVLVLTFSFSTTGFAQIIADGTYKILNTVNSEVMSINTIAPGNAGNPDNLAIGRAKMEAHTTGNNLQLWTFTHQGSDIYKVQNVGDATILGIKDGWCGTFGDVQVGFADASDWILFKISAASVADRYVFEIAFDADCNFGSTNTPIKAFDIDGGNSGAKIQTFDVDNTNPNQQFQIVTEASLSVADVAINSLKVIYNQNQRTVAINSDDSSNTNTKVNVLDMNGRIVRSFENATSQNLQIDFNGTANGLYFIQIENKNRRRVKKVLIF